MHSHFGGRHIEEAFLALFLIRESGQFAVTHGIMRWRSSFGRIICTQHIYVKGVSCFSFSFVTGSPEPSDQELELTGSHSLSMP